MNRAELTEFIENRILYHFKDHTETITPVEWKQTLVSIINEIHGDELQAPDLEIELAKTKEQALVDIAKAKQDGKDEAIESMVNTLQAFVDTEHVVEYDIKDVSGMKRAVDIIKKGV